MTHCLRVARSVPQVPTIPVPLRRRCVWRRSAETEAIPMDISEDISRKIETIQGDTRGVVEAISQISAIITD